MQNRVFHSVVLVGRPQSEQVPNSIRSIADWLANRGITVYLDSNTAKTIPESGHPSVSLKRMNRHCDLAITVGGDGTLLGAARELAPFAIPLIGINHGRLGFVTDATLKCWETVIASVLEGHFSSEYRSLLTAQVIRNKATVWSELALNDVVVNRSFGTSMIELEVEVDGVYMYRQRADGLILATPTGSTAYALSANGPILHPQTQGFVLAPIAPQTLSTRPIVLPDSAVVTIRVLDGLSARVSGDMQVYSDDLQPHDKIVISRANFDVCFLHPQGYSYFSTLRNKLGWQEQPASWQQ